MAWPLRETRMMAPAIPYIVAGLGAASAVQQQNTSDRNAQIAQGEAKQAEAQALNEEGQVRQQGREFLDRQSAAIGQAGIGYGGSAQRIQQQSSISSELDALNVRYQGRLRGFGYQTQAANQRAEGTQYGLLAGASALKGYADYRGGQGKLPSG